MGPDRVAFANELSNQIGSVPHHITDHEKLCLHAFGGKNFEYLLSVSRQRTIVESKHDFMIIQLEIADPRRLFWIDHNCPPGTNRIRVVEAFQPNRWRGIVQKGSATYAEHATAVEHTRPDNVSIHWTLPDCRVPLSRLLDLASPIDTARFVLSNFT
jgi:hypothetical protein